MVRGDFRATKPLAVFGGLTPNAVVSPGEFTAVTPVRCGFPQGVVGRFATGNSGKKHKMNIGKICEKKTSKLLQMKMVYFFQKEESNQAPCHPGSECEARSG